MKRTDKYREEYERERERERQSRNNYDINEENRRRFYEHQQKMRIQRQALKILMMIRNLNFKN